MDEKTCTGCKQSRPSADFSRSARSKDGLQARCRRCARDWYVANRETHKANTARRTRDLRDEYHRRLLAYLDGQACVECGEDDVVVLEFDHREATGKVREVARLISDLVASAKVEAEMAKCDVCCANCHRRRTAERGRQRRYRHQQERQSQVRSVAQDRLRRVLPAP
ncbi:MAG: hypothetical protein JWO60_845 [Frankiales bacterium]|nr:hypothetical protein [Frankiales bacterium]